MAHTWLKAGVYDIKVYVETDYQESIMKLISNPLPVKVMHKFEVPEDGITI